MVRAEGAPAFTLSQLAVFVAVTDAGTISAAAQVLHISPSAVSAALTELERALRVQLVYRQRAKGVSLTPTGEALVAQAKSLLHQAGELEADARGSEAGVSGRVRVGCYSSLAPTVLPTVVSEFAARHPDARVDVFEGTQDQLVTGLGAGELDVALMYDIQLAPRWRRAQFARLTPHAALPHDHPLASAEGPIRLADLKDDPLILLDSPPSTDHILAMCQQAGFTPKIEHRVKTYETARSFVGRGLGWTLQVQRPSADVTYEGHPIVVKDIAEPVLAEVAACVVWDPGTLLTRAACTFVSDVVRGTPDKPQFS